MNAQQHQRIKDVFAELCDETPAVRRTRLAEIETDDPDLAHDVEALLKHSDTPAFDLDDVAQLSSLIGECGGGPIVDVPRPLRIGMYEVLDEIGQGGMGVVYLAQQHTPLDRRVAIKVIRPGMDSRQVLSRFDVERRTIASMNHPGIATVHDAGVTDEGRPYFVMQHVEGERITTFCDAHRLSVAARLALFIKVCDAVVHAHQKGVIHRDLKPSNILIEMQDGTPVPKVIDFGVAKAMGPAAGEDTMYTAPGQLIGTPQYMSPEQTQLDGMHADTRSDVFSLGALLYELLSGSTPIDAETIRSASFDQVCRMIRENVAVPPSRRIEQMPAEVAQHVARDRNTTPGELARTLRGELDWITRTAMEKEPQRRYETVAALAADIARYQRHEPVSAGPLTASYRMRTFVRRHRSAVIAGAAVVTLFMLLVLAVAGGAVLYAFQAQQIADQERAIAEKERENADQARKATRQAQEVARQAENNKLIVDFMDNLFTTANPTKGLGADMTLREFIDVAAQRLRTDEAIPDEVRASLHNTVGATYAGFGDYVAAESHFREAWTFYERSVGMADSRPLRAVANLVHTLDILEREDEALQIGMTWMPVAENVLGPLGHETRSFYNNMAILLEDVGQLDDAEVLYRKAFESDQNVEGAIPATWMRSQMNLGTFLVKQGRIDEGAPLLEECVTIADDFYGPTHPETLTATANLILLRERQNRLDDASVLSKELIEISQRELGPTHPATLSRVRNQAALCLRLGKFSEAEALVAPIFTQARAAHGSSHPATLSLSEMLVTAVAFQDRIEEATNLAIECYDNVLEEVPADHGYARRAATLVADAYDTWQKPDKYHEWLIKAGEEAPRSSEP